MKTSTLIMLGIGAAVVAWFVLKPTPKGGAVVVAPDSPENVAIKAGIGLATDLLSGFLERDSDDVPLDLNPPAGDFGLNLDVPEFSLN